jgi:hypothetical protein
LEEECSTGFGHAAQEADDFVIHEVVKEEGRTDQIESARDGGLEGIELEEGHVQALLSGPPLSVSHGQWIHITPMDLQGDTLPESPPLQGPGHIAAPARDVQEAKGERAVVECLPASVLSLNSRQSADLPPYAAGGEGEAIHHGQCLQGMKMLGRLQTLLIHELALEHPFTQVGPQQGPEEPGPLSRGTPQLGTRGQPRPIQRPMP